MEALKDTFAQCKAQNRVSLIAFAPPQLFWWFLNGRIPSFVWGMQTITPGQNTTLDAWFQGLNGRGSH